MKKRFFSIIVFIIILCLIPCSSYATVSNKALYMPADTKLEMLALSQITYNIPSKSLWALSASDEYNIMSGTSVRVIELNDNNKPATITIQPQDMPIYPDEAFTKHSLSYKVSLYNSNGKLVEVENDQKRICQLQTIFTCKSHNFQQNLNNTGITQWMAHFDGFSISLPKSAQKTKYYIVFEPSDKNVISVLSEKNLTINEPSKKDISIMYDKIYYDYFGYESIQDNTKILSSSFLDKIHPGRMYDYNKEPVYWKKLIRQVLPEYTYLENCEDTNITGAGFFAATYKNEKTGDIIIAYRGTELISIDLADDIIFGITSLKSAQMLLANQYYKYIRQKYKDCNIMLTGHSLGGTLANSVTFENMGNQKSTTFSPDGNISQNTKYYGGPISVGFNAATNYILDTYAEKVNSAKLYGNFINVVTDEYDFINGLVVGGNLPNEILSEIKIRHSLLSANITQIAITSATQMLSSAYSGIHTELLPFSGNISHITNIKDGVHGLSSLVEYDGEFFQITSRPDIG